MYGVKWEYSNFRIGIILSCRFGATVLGTRVFGPVAIGGCDGVEFGVLEAVGWMSSVLIAWIIGLLFFACLCQ